MEVATISRTADATQAAENAADAAMAMTARRDAVASEGETSCKRDDDTFARVMAPPAKRAKKKPHRWHQCAQEAQYNVIESDDDVNNEATLAKMGEFSMGNDGFDSPPGLRLTGHTASRAGGDKKL